MGKTMMSQTILFAIILVFLSIIQCQAGTGFQRRQAGGAGGDDGDGNGGPGGSGGNGGPGGSGGNGGTGGSGGQNCCKKKKEGSNEYTYKKTGDTSKYDCVDKCIYEKDGKMFCFKKKSGGSVECMDNAGSNTGTDGSPGDDAVADAIADTVNDAVDTVADAVGDAVGDAVADAVAVAGADGADTAAEAISNIE